ncbi:MAG: hypothetical protein J1E40_07770 [Oscillospiraceae bacterium]|nr:hypothetical protein [Oscillospiraceae bacterium]
MNNEIINYLGEKFGCCLSADYYNKINEWRLWWIGFYEPFHRISFENGESYKTKDMYTMKMAKKICEDWASILINDKTSIKLDDKYSADFLMGDTENGGVFGSNNFWEEANGLMERMMWSGTAAVVIRLKNVSVDRKGKIIPSPEAKIDLNYIDADMIIPMSCDNGIITEAAFCSELYLHGSKKIYLEIHRLDGREYVIENHLFNADRFGGSLKEDMLPEGIPPIIKTGSEKPWFSICRPAIVNPFPESNGLGCSIFYNAIDNLKGADLAYNNFNSDIWLGQKKVFLSKSLMSELSGEKKISPDEVNQQLFYYISETIDDGTGKPLVQEHNPELRVEENIAAVQAQLDLISFKVGFGTKHYQFNTSHAVTATQYIGDKQDMIQNAHKHFIHVEGFLHRLVKTILQIGCKYIDRQIDPDSRISVVFDQSPFIDENSERERDRQDVLNGILAPWEYRMKWFGESEEEARAVVSEIACGERGDERV